MVDVLVLRSVEPYHGIRALVWVLATVSVCLSMYVYLKYICSTICKIIYEFFGRLVYACIYCDPCKLVHMRAGL